MSFEQIEIKNFLGLTNINIDIKKLTIIIGPQSSGKSVTAKLIHFFKSIYNYYLDIIENEETKRELNILLYNKFIEYFPQETWINSNFEIKYTNKKLIFLVSKTKSQKKPKFEFDQNLDKIFRHCRNSYKRLQKKLNKENDEKFDIFFDNDPRYELRKHFFEHLKKESNNLGYRQLYIPAGRSFYANLQSSIFTFLSNNNAIDPFLKDFGAFYESIKKMIKRPIKENKERNEIINKANKLINIIVKGEFINEKGGDYLILDDGRKLKLNICSSGQQEVLPLVIILLSLLNLNFLGNGSTCYIEEPEAHLFPYAQKDIINLISLVFNKSSSDIQFIITTHSPYILTSINNNLEGGMLYSTITQEKKEELLNLIDKDFLLSPEDVGAYSIIDGISNSLICPDTSLITSDIIDNVSNELAIQFNNLLNLD